jgi:hypothetical protein
MNSQTVVVQGGPTGKPAKSFTLGASDPYKFGFYALDGLVRQAAGTLGFSIGHLEAGRTLTFDDDGTPAPRGCRCGTVTLQGDNGRCTIGPIVLGPEALGQFHMEVPEPDAPPFVPVPAAPATLEDLVQNLRERIERLERQQAWGQR